MVRKISARKNDFLPILDKKSVLGRSRLFTFLPMIRELGSMGREILKSNWRFSAHDRGNVSDGKKRGL